MDIQRCSHGITVLYVFTPPVPGADCAAEFFLSFSGDIRGGGGGAGRASTRVGRPITAPLYMVYHTLASSMGRVLRQLRIFVKNILDFIKILKF